MNLSHAFLPVALMLAASPLVAHAERGFEVRDMAAMDRYSAPTLSPDGRKLVFAKRVVDFAANKSSTSLWIEDLLARDAAPPARLTPEGWNVNSPAFSNDGKSVYFLSAKSGSMQLYAIPVAGGAPTQLTDFSTDIGSYKLSPDGSRLAFSTEAFAECKSDFSCNLKKLKERQDSKSTGLVFDRMFIRHWDSWNDGRLNRVFVAPLGDGKAQLKAATLVGADVLGDVPSKPFGDDSEYSWAPDGKSLVLSARKADREEPWSTNFDLFQVSADGTGAAKNLTAANKAWDTGPVFSSDGGTLYYRAMKRSGFEADRFALMAMDLGTGKTREIAAKWDASADGITLSDDGTTIYTTAQELGQHPLFSVSIEGGNVSQVVGGGSVSAFDIAGPTLAYAQNSLKSGDQLFTGALGGGAAASAARAITPSAGEMLEDVAFGDYEQFDFIGWNN